MATATVPVEVSDDLIELLGSPEAVAEQMHRSFVLDLLRQGRIGQGRAAILLGIDRWELLDADGALSHPVWTADGGGGTAGRRGRPPGMGWGLARAGRE